jgi:hypothetical protein
MKKVWIVCKRILIVLVVILGLLIVVWRIDRTFFHPYIPGFSEQIRNDISTYKYSIPKSKESCEQAGGTWKKVAIDPVETCNLPTTDAGKACSSSNVCEGVCLANLSQDELRSGMKGRLIKTEGICSKWVKVYGCVGFVYQGWAQVICLD